MLRKRHKRVRYTACRYTIRLGLDEAPYDAHIKHVGGIDQGCFHPIDYNNPIPVPCVLPHTKVCGLFGL